MVLSCLLKVYLKQRSRPINVWLIITVYMKDLEALLVVVLYVKHVLDRVVKKKLKRCKVLGLLNVALSVPVADRSSTEVVVVVVVVAYV